MYRDMSDLPASAVAEQLAINKELESATAPDPRTVDIAKLRHARRFKKDGTSRVAIAEDAFDTNVGDFQVRVFPTANHRGLYLHFHGGGWVLGSIYEQDKHLARLARKTRLQVMTIDYPLAPESALPATLDHAEAAVRGVLAASPQLPCYLGGESAGAHIALSVALRLRDTELLSRIQALSLCYGIYDLSMTPSQRGWGERFLGLSTPHLDWFYELALPGLTAEERRSPNLSPLYQTCEDMPPALFVVGTEEPLLDDTLFMAARWQAAGNDTQLAVYPGAPHGFNGMNTALGRHGNEVIYEFIGN